MQWQVRGWRLECHQWKRKNPGGGGAWLTPNWTWPSLFPGLVCLLERNLISVSCSCLDLEHKGDWNPAAALEIACLNPSFRQVWHKLAHMLPDCPYAACRMLANAKGFIFSPPYSSFLRIRHCRDVFHPVLFPQGRLLFRISDGDCFTIYIYFLKR